MRDAAPLRQQRRMKQAVQFIHKDSADLLPLDGLKKLGSSKDTVSHPRGHARLGVPAHRAASRVRAWSQPGPPLSAVPQALGRDSSWSSELTLTRSLTASALPEPNLDLTLPSCAGLPILACILGAEEAALLTQPEVTPWGRVRTLGRWTRRFSWHSPYPDGWLVEVSRAHPPPYKISLFSFGLSTFDLLC